MHVGLTGGVASGKSTVSAIMAEHGAIIIDSDLLAREVVAAGTEGLAAVVDLFGPGILTAEGELDRPAMGSIVFADEARRRQLEGIIHPLVGARALALAESAGPDDVVVHDIPLLVETGQGGNFEAVVVVDVPAEVQVERMTQKRGMSEADARARIAAQATREQRLAVATHVIDNTGTHEDLRQRVAEVLVELRGGSGS